MEEIVFIIIFASRACLIANGRHGNHTLSSSMSKEECLLSEYDKQHKKALYEMLPLLLYPIFFLLFTTPIFGFAKIDIETQSRPLNHPMPDVLGGLGYFPRCGASLHLCCSFLIYVLSGASIK